MKINEILDCYNKAFDLTGNPNGIHYVSHSNWERLIGTCKKATTIITAVDLNNNTKEIIKAESISNVLSGQEEALIEDSQRKALISFIVYYDTRIK